MNYETALVAISSPDDIVRIVMTIIVLTIVGLAFPLAQRWANGSDSKKSQCETLSLQPEWVLRQGKKVVDRFDDQTEATREFTRRIAS